MATSSEGRAYESFLFVFHNQSVHRSLIIDRDLGETTTQYRMAKSKTGPPYTDRNAEYVVVTTPWGMNRVPRSRVPEDFNRLAAWVQLILQDKDIDAKVECIFGMGTVSVPT